MGGGGRLGSGMRMGSGGGWGRGTDCRESAMVDTVVAGEVGGEVGMVSSSDAS